MIEMIIVILIAGILAVIIAPRITALYPIKLSGAAEKLASDLKYAQSLAMSRHIKHGVFFEPALQKYTVYCYSVGTPVEDPLKRGDDLIVDYTSDSRYQGIEIDSAYFPASPLTDRVEFDSTLGRPSSGGEVDLSCRDASCKIIVTENTGRVRVE